MPLIAAAVPKFREYVNTLMLQDVLAEEEWSGLLGPADRRGLTPLFWQHVRPYLDRLWTCYVAGPVERAVRA
jgi:hypothetical protein